jgi:hypothetical protein
MQRRTKMECEIQCIFYLLLKGIIDLGLKKLKNHSFKKDQPKIPVKWHSMVTAIIPNQ